MRTPAPRHKAVNAPFFWRGALRIACFAAAALGIYGLSEAHILNEELVMLLLFVALPIAAFALSGAGQDTTESTADSE